MKEHNPWPLAGGEMAAMVRTHDWSQTPLGPLEAWPQTLKTIAGVVLASPSPLILLWGPELVQIYNEGYRDIMGAKHPGGLGQRNRECWGEVWEFTSPVYEGVFRGESFTFENKRLILERHGYPEETFFTLTYSPVPDETGSVGGILVSVFETTEKVGHERITVLEEVFRTAPSFLHVLHGPRFVFEFVNEAYYQLVGDRELIGRPAFEALPEAAGGGYQEHIARVMETRQPFVGRELPVTLARTPGAPPEERIIDVVYLPLIDADGGCSRVVGHGTDVTDYVRSRREAERALRESEVRQAAAVLREEEARKSAAALRQSEERYRNLFESMDEGYCIIEVLFDPADASRAVDYRFVEINPAFEAQSGMHGVIGRRMLEFVSSIEPQWLENYGRVALTGEPVRFANEYKGLNRWFEVYAFRVAEGARNVAVLFTDITARRQAEAALRESEQRYRTLFETIDEGFCVIEFLDGPEGSLSDYVHVEANPAFERHAGISNAVGQKVRELVPGEAEGWVELYRKVLLTGEPIRFERELVATGRHLELSAFRVEPENRRQVAVLFQDITERRRSEEALRASEERFRQIADTMAHMIWVTLPDGYHEWYNRRWYEFTGVPEGTTDGEGWSGTFHPDDQPRAWAHWRRSLATGEPYEIEYRLRHHSGDYRWVLGRALPIRDSQGAIERWFGTCTDIDAMKRAEKALQETARHKDEFLAMLAHELRNPLAPILNATAILEVRGGSDPVIQRQRQVIQRQAQHMTRLVADLLDVSRLQRGTYMLEQEPLDLVRTIRNCVEDYRGTLESQGLEVVASLPDTPLPVYGDRVRLSQALGNLVSNAAKFTPSGGKVQIDLQAVETDRARQAVVSVRDTGMGIPREALSTIWEIFVQGKQDLARSMGGLGLGLGLVKGIVELHGGTVSAASAGEGHGAEFTLTIPILADTASPAAGATSSAAVRDEGGRRILLIEDNRDAAETLQELLELHGYEVHLAFNGSDGLEAARHWKPSVVLCDLGLPELSGHEIAVALRGDPTTRELRLIAVSGYAQPADTDRSRAAGFDHHLAKPVKLDTLLPLIREAGRGG